MKFYTLLAMLAATATLTFTGCSVEQTEEGNMPEFEKTEEGNMPEYDVDAADVDVGTTETQMTVPTVDVNMPADNDETPAPPPAQ